MELEAGVLCGLCSESVVAQIMSVRSEFWCLLFSAPSVELENKGVCSASLSDSTTMGTMSNLALLARVGLLLEVPVERWVRVLVSYSMSAMITRLVSVFALIIP